jgi:ligand-binding SRPBCC domain-containing protein
MVKIYLATRIAAPIERCFDLSRCIDAHMASTDWTGERAIAGVTTGLIGPGQEVTWKGRHFGLNITHTSRITEYDRPHYFQDCMVRGAFRRFCHDHYFTLNEGGTLMTDAMQFEAPLGYAGRLIEPILEKHMRNLLRRRNEYIREIAEDDQWRKYLAERLPAT